MEEDLQILLGDLCKGGGFCSASIYEVLTTEGPLTAEAFAHAVLLAEGWTEPEHEYEYRSQFIRLFTERYGPSISAEDYRVE